MKDLLFRRPMTGFGFSTACVFIVLCLGACTKKEGRIETNRRSLPGGAPPQLTVGSGFGKLSATEPRAAAVVPGPKVPEEFQAAAWSFSGVCNIDRLNEKPPQIEPLVIRKGDILRLDGWAIAQLERSVPTKLFVVFQRPSDAARWYAAVEERVPRPDVAQAKGNAAYSTSGFTAVIDSGPLPLGELKVFLAYRDGANPEICDNGRQIRVQ